MTLLSADNDNEGRGDGGDNVLSQKGVTENTTTTNNTSTTADPPVITTLPTTATTATTARPTPTGCSGTTTTTSTSTTATNTAFIPSPVPPSSSQPSTCTDGVTNVAGILSGQYNCTYEGVHGILYAGNQALYFVGSYFLFGKKVPLSWDMIRQVVQLDQGVQVWTKSDEIHTFTGLQQPSRVWPVLVSLHNDALLDRRPNNVTAMGAATTVLAPGSSSHTTAAATAKAAAVAPVLHPGTNNFMSIKRCNSDPPVVLERMTLFSNDNDDDTSNNDNRNQNSDHRDKHKEAMSRTNGTKNSKLETSVLPEAPVLEVPGLSQEQVRDKLGAIKVPPIECTYDQARGKLYAGWKGFYFYGCHPFLFWQVKQIYFPFGSMKQMKIVSSSPSSSDATTTRTQARGGGGGLKVRLKNGQAYLFEGMENADKVWASLIALRNEILMSTATRSSKGGGAGTGTGAGGGGGSGGYMFRGTIVRTNSDPNLSVWNINVPDEDDDGTGTENEEEEQDTTTKMPQRGGGLPTFRSPTTTNNNTTTPSPTTRTTNGRSTEQHHTSSPPQASHLQLKQLWDECVAQKSKYRNLVVDQLVLKNCSSLDEFVAKFLADGASHSIANYLESRGDSALRASDWEPVTAAAAAATTTTTTQGGAQPTHCQRRVIHYKHPVNAPLAPPQAGARKEQTLTRYGDHGLCLETRTIVADVPMADCFHVDDRIRVECLSPCDDHGGGGSSGSGGGSGGMVVCMEFEITFIKSTMFKGIIEKTTRSEFTDFFTQMGGYLSTAFAEAAPILPVPTNPEPVQAQPSGFWSRLRGGATAAFADGSANSALLILLVLLQCYMIREMSSVRGELHQVRWHHQQQQEQLRSLLSTCPS